MQGWASFRSGHLNSIQVCLLGWWTRSRNVQAAGYVNYVLHETLGHEAKCTSNNDTSNETAAQNWVNNTHVLLCMKIWVPVADGASLSLSSCPNLPTTGKLVCKAQEHAQCWQSILITNQTHTLQHIVCSLFGEHAQGREQVATAAEARRRDARGKPVE